MDDARAEGADELARMRERMVDRQLKARGLRDTRVLEAMGTVPRERFIPARSQHEAYADRPISIGRGQTISQPYMVAKMLEVLDCKPEHRVLEIGAGSGYQAALLGELCAEVWGIEIVEDLAEKARQVLLDLGYDNVQIVVGDGTEGLSEQAPYDRIVVAAAAPEVPEPLTEQLADAGRLVIPVGGRMSQQLAVIDRRGDELIRSNETPCVFVPLVGRHGWGDGG